MAVNRTRGVIALAVGLLTASTVLAQSAQPRGDAEAIALGQTLVLRNCGMCHAVGRADVSSKAGAPAFRDLSRRYDVDALGEALAEGLLTGHPEMPEFRFEPYEVDAILKYLRSIQARQRVGGSGTASGR